MITYNGCLYFKPNTRVQQKNGVIDLNGQSHQVSSSYTGDPKMVIGTGSNEETKGDYNLNSPVELTLITETSKGSGAGSEASAYGDPIYTDTATFRNDTDQTVTIKELGLIFKDSWNSYWFLIYRKVIDPVSIEPGQTKAFSITIA